MPQPPYPQQFPDLAPEVAAALRASIQRFGMLVPVICDQHGRILDGRHRARIAADLGVNYRTDTIIVSNEEEAAALQHTLNADRRHLTPKQRRELAIALRQEGHSYRAIGGALGVSHEQARKDTESAGVNHLTPERSIGLDRKSYPARRPVIVTAKNRREAKRVQTALEQVETLPEGRVLDVKRVERIAREQDAERRRQQPTGASSQHGTVELRHGDFRTVLSDLAGQVDAIVCDPPYGQDYLPLFSDLSHLAAMLLKPSGVLAVVVGQLYLPEYLARLSEHMTYRWTGAYLAQGPRTHVHHARVGAGWKPILLYQRKDATEVPWLLDDLFISDGADKKHHLWGQSESGMAVIVERLTTAGGLVVDPFLGGGTTAVVVCALGRRFVGCDIDAAAIATARERLA